MAFDVRKLGDPSTFQDSGFGPRFVEGNIQVVESRFMVHKNPDPQPRADGKTIAEEDLPKPHLALYWRVKRLDENTDPIRDENGEVFEDMYFSLGGQSLARKDRDSGALVPLLHPGRSDGPDDEQIEDAGSEVGAWGPTVCILDKENFKGLNRSSAYSVLCDSLCQAHVRPNTPLAWAPAFVGMVVHMTNVTTRKEKGKDVPIMDTGRKDQRGNPILISYRAVDKIHTQPSAGAAAAKSAPVPAPAPAPKAAKGAAAAAPAAAAPAPAATNGAGDYQNIALQVLEGIGNDESLAGTKYTKRSFYSLCGERIRALGYNGDPFMAVMRVVKEEPWLQSAAEACGLTLDIQDGKLNGVAVEA